MKILLAKPWSLQQLKLADGKQVQISRPGNQFFGIEGEESFNRLLLLERRRTERSGSPFVLSLMNVASLPQTKTPSSIAMLCNSISARTRDTDVIGWYQSLKEIGILYTMLGDAERNSIIGTLTQKMREALVESIGPDKIHKVPISFHFFPEDYGGTETSHTLDEKLYPDLTRMNSSKNIRYVLKRALDVAGSIGGILICSPFLIAIPVLIKLTSNGPVLFRQQRIGLLGKDFTFLKFRSMAANSDPAIHKKYVEDLIQKRIGDKEQEGKSGPVYKLTNDPRITPLGRFLRKTSLDELPQLFNVLKGDMSLVGPRPPIPYEVAAYRSWHRRRIIEVKPGITGLWQVHGRSRTTFDEMVRLDLQYISTQSLWLDIKLILQTPLAVLIGSGAY
jgi:lipopolysaccharide/colanic/teichoic acid biosynthesis glycosyltransferase